VFTLQSIINQIAEIEQTNERQKQIIDRLMIEQQQSDATKDNLQRIVVNQRKEIKKFSKKYKAQEVLVIALRNKNEEIMQKYEQLESTLSALMASTNKNDDDVKEERTDCMTTEECVQWIVGLDKVRYGKYYGKLLKNMSKEGIDGDCLAHLCKNDLYRLGVVQFKDKRDIMMAIRQFVKSKSEVIASSSSINL